MQHVLLAMFFTACAAPSHVQDVEIINPGLILSPGAGLANEVQLIAAVWSDALEPFWGPNFVAVADDGVEVYTAPREDVWLWVSGKKRWVNAFQQSGRIVIRNDVDSFECRSRILAHEVGHSLGAVHQKEGLMFKRGPIQPAEVCTWEIDDTTLASVIKPNFT